MASSNLALLTSSSCSGLRTEVIRFGICPWGQCRGAAVRNARAKVAPSGSRRAVATARRNPWGARRERTLLSRSIKAVLAAATSWSACLLV